MKKKKKKIKATKEKADFRKKCVELYVNASEKAA